MVSQNQDQVAQRRVNCFWRPVANLFIPRIQLRRGRSVEWVVPECPPCHGWLLSIRRLHARRQSLIINCIGFQTHFHFAKLSRERGQGYTLWECPNTWHDAGYMRLACVCCDSGTPSANVIVFSDSDALGPILSDRFPHFLEDRHGD